MTTELQPFEPLRKRQPYASQYADFPDPREEYGYAFPGNPHCDEAKAIERITMSDSNRIMHAVLDEAKGIVCGDRQDAYGLPEVNHSRTAQFWSTYLGIMITPRQVCEMNALQKLSRQVNSYSHDNLVDVIGFCANAVACEAAAKVDGT